MQHIQKIRYFSDLHLEFYASEDIPALLQKITPDLSHYDRGCLCR